MRNSLHAYCDRPTHNEKLCCYVAFVGIIAITLLVVGILGATSIIPMTPEGAFSMCALGGSTLAGLFLGAIRVCCLTRN